MGKVFESLHKEPSVSSSAQFLLDEEVRDADFLCLGIGPGPGVEVAIASGINAEEDVYYPLPFDIFMRDYP